MSNAPTTIRLQLRANGFSSIPVNGKRPSMPGWQEKFVVTADEIALWEKLYSYDTNTGVLAKRCPGLDIDITHPEAAAAIELLAREHFEEHGNILARTGLPPKRLIPLRTDEPFAKLLRVFTAPNGSTHRIEILGDGQQYVAFGIHPDTKAPYRWHGGDPTTTKRENLPYVRRESAEQFLDAASRLLVEEFGFTPVAAETAAPGNGDARQRERTNTRWGALNARAGESRRMGAETLSDRQAHEGWRLSRQFRRPRPRFSGRPEHRSARDRIFRSRRPGGSARGTAHSGRACHRMAACGGTASRGVAGDGAR
jgi:Bifunctional DNA primase/polymerase, N-terminal